MTMSLPSSPMDPTDRAHNYVVVGGFQSPGRAQITGLRISYNWDIQESYGFAAAFMTFRGRKLTRFNLNFLFTTKEDFIAWAEFSKLLEPPVSKLTPFVIGMQHPALASAGIANVTVLERGIPERTPGAGWVVSCSMIEWKPPFKVLVKPRGAIPAAEKGIPTTPKSQLDIDLEKQIKDLEAAKTAANTK